MDCYAARAMTEQVDHGVLMYRIRFHGRGGQGMKTASRILGSAFFAAGFEVQDAPRYGAERRGAPIFAYVRAAREPINERGIIDRPDLVVVADDTLVPVPAAGVLAGIDTHTVLLINTPESADTWRHRLNIASPVITLPASADVADRADIPYMGAAWAGAAARLVGVLSRDALAEAIRTELADMGPAVIDRNLENALEAFDGMAAHGGLVSEGGMISASGYDKPDWTELPFETARISSPTVYAVANSVEVRTGLWRTLRPVIDYERCNRCWWVCSTFCPDGAIDVDTRGSPVIDYDNCKGCLICVAQCPPHAIEAIPEHQAQLAETTEDAE
ncbi:MAG: 2-oxoacid:acceptor oxidoreductase family protein [Thiohalobacterales bacterium]|nr:2-oxoacid:acceptor oxidoreductase family protein [Thiohalobacterales bacterium]